MLQANEVNSNLVVVPCNSSRASAHHHQHSCPPDGASSGGGLRSRHHSSTTTTSSASPKSVKYGSNYTDARQTKEDPGSAATTPTKDTNIFANLYTRLCQWMSAAGVGSKRSGAESRGGSRSRTPRTPQSLSRSSSVASTKSQDLYQLLANMPGEYHNSCIHASLSSEDSELSSFHRTSYSSTCSSLTVTSTSTTCSGDWHVQASNTDSFPASAISTGYYTPCHDDTLVTSVCSKFRSVGNKGIPHTNLTFTISCPLRTKQTSLSGQDCRDRSSLCATWPPTGRKLYQNGELLFPYVLRV